MKAAAASSLLLLLGLSPVDSVAPIVQLVGRPGADYSALERTVRAKLASATAAVRRPVDVLLPGADLAGYHASRSSSSEPRRRLALVLQGNLDGVARFSRFAAARHRFASDASRFVVVEGAAHRSFYDDDAPHPLDLQPALDDAQAHAQVADLVLLYATNDNADDEEKVAAAERRAAQLAAPIVKALQLEGSPHLGKDICNSDYPTNPSCNYPKYPDFALPPGPAPAPSPLPAADCICGSQWVTDFAFPIVAGASDKGFAVQAADAFHDVSDTHPFHLPHNWNSCASPQGCTLNVTTLTMNVNGSGSLFPNATDPPLSALELRTKMKSRKILWEAAGLGTQSGDVDKKNMTICRRANQMAWDWAMDNAAADVAERFKKSGTPFVMVDDVEAPIGLTGPTWIKKELLFTPSADKRSIEVQSWAFVVPESPIKTKYLPTGMHYCKLLSPARAMEWIYTDGLRDGLGVKAHQAQRKYL